MQAFVSFAAFDKSAEVMDWRRLGNQRGEVTQMHNALTKGAGWGSHPATLMWKGYEDALLLFGVMVCTEWIARGYRDSTLVRYAAMLDMSSEIAMPPWIGDERVHSTRRTALLFKDWQWYSQFGWQEAKDGPPASYEYFWPSLSVDYGGTGDGILRK